ncbi:MAG: 16S rRNA (uracil(1498)-N(3))-methyltransferase [Bacillota bacterium]|nr:16S rRNA (uracil(1498)-N(3))-methyltransferase [Bacillota bacterium]
MHRFFISPQNIHGSKATIDPDQSRHIEKVLRLGVGSRVTAFDGQGNEYELYLLEKQKDFFIGKIEAMVQKDNEPSLKLCLIQGIAKGDKMDTIIQKAVEIGVSQIYPLESQHGVVRLDEKKAHKKVERWQTIATEACKQCCRNLVPVVHHPLAFADLLALVQNKPTIILYENEKHTSIREIITKNRSIIEQNHVYLIIGPEGGFSDNEVIMLVENGAFAASLGPRILRTETAGLVGASILLYEMGDMET